MNREVLKGITVFDKRHYANDALQYICQAIFHVDDRLVISTIKSGIPPDERSEEYYKAVANCDALLLMFNNIVGKGKEFALQFIENNKELI